MEIDSYYSFAMANQIIISSFISVKSLQEVYQLSSGINQIKNMLGHFDTMYTIFMDLKLLVHINFFFYSRHESDDNCKRIKIFCELSKFDLWNIWLRYVKIIFIWLNMFIIIHKYETCLSQSHSLKVMDYEFEFKFSILILLQLSTKWVYKTIQINWNLKLSLIA